MLQPIPHDQNIFTDQQESDLGDILSDSLVSDEDVVEDAAMNQHLHDIADRIVPYLPPNQFRLHFSLIELAEANAFSLPGGRIYISRKLIVSLKNDDELAAILAHELGHVVTHQGAILMTQELRQVLNVNSVGNRADIADKIHRVREIWATRKIRIHQSDQADQQAADQVSIYAMARSGFRLQAFVDAMDRTAELHGKTGNWVTDFFRTTKPEQKRFREAIRVIASMPAECVVPAKEQTSTFSDWQSQVIAFKAAGARERLTGVVFREKLAQPLRPTILNLRFSPDGKYVLVQDEGGIHVLTRDPFATLFFIPASDAYKAFFTPDSKSIVFYTPALRIERWDVVSQKRVMVREMVLKTSCVQTKLSPDGTTLACYDFDGTLWLFDTADNDPILEKKSFFHPTEFGMFLIRRASIIDSAEAASANTDSEAPFLFLNLGFSPDGKYFLAGSVLLAGDESKTLGYDLPAKHEASLSHGVREAIRGQFVFLGNDRIAAVDMRNALKSPVVSFPSGQKLEELPLAAETHLLASSDGGYLIAGPVKDFALSLLDVKTRNSRARLKFDAADVYNGVLISELADGTLALSDLASAKTIATMTLKESRLGFSADVIVSPDFKWLAASTRSRGAMWDLTANTRTHSVRGFRGGWFAGNGSLYADFPKSGEQVRAIVQIDSKPGSPTRIACSLGELEAHQFGPYLLITTPEKKGGFKNWTFELHDLTNKNTVWSHHFPQESPATVWNTEASKVLVRWNTFEFAAKEELKQYPEWKTSARNADFLFEVIDFHQDKIVGKLLLNTNWNSFKITNNTFDGDWIAISTDDGSVLIYSLVSGQETTHVFGYSPDLSAAGKLLVVTQSERILDLYDLENSELRAQYKFSNSVVYRAFSADGRRLFVLTSDQTAYILDLAAPASPAATSVASTASN